MIVLVDDSEDIERLKNVERSKICVKESEVVFSVKNCSWEAEFIIIDWLDVSTVVKINIESVTEKVLTEYISVENAEDC